MPPSTWTNGSFLVPARDSRHRAACLSLYRALLRLSCKVTLPDELSSRWGTKRHYPSVLVRRAFNRNRADTSPRLVVSAMQAGYRMIDTLARASADRESPEYASVIAFLRANLTERERTLDAKAKHIPANAIPPRLRSAPHPLSQSLLVKTTPASTPLDPNPKPVYTSAHRPRPRAALGGSGRRRVPVLDMAGDVPFLRLKKPQPEILSRVILQKVRKRASRTGLVKQMFDKDMPESHEEDEWEKIVAKLAREEGVASTSRKRNTRKLIQGREQEDSGDWLDDASGDVSYARTLRQYGIAEVSEKLNRERIDLVARADAMRAIIAEEAALANQEKEERILERKSKWEARMLQEHGENWRKVIEDEEI
ncbi:hypothetical protein BX600DRAFT_436254 [Xylariales sp. PMI_506]|nr:hypothetical protein BX600DRAFT_436254 [Xylariales sp. PMI_506]